MWGWLIQGRPDRSPGDLSHGWRSERTDDYARWARTESQTSITCAHHGPLFTWRFGGALSPCRRWWLTSLAGLHVRLASAAALSIHFDFALVMFCLLCALVLFDVVARGRCTAVLCCRLARSRLCVRFVSQWWQP